MPSPLISSTGNLLHAAFEMPVWTVLCPSVLCFTLTRISDALHSSCFWRYWLGGGGQWCLDTARHSFLTAWAVQTSSVPVLDLFLTFVYLVTFCVFQQVQVKRERFAAAEISVFRFVFHALGFKRNFKWLRFEREEHLRNPGLKSTKLELQIIYWLI